MTPAAKYLRPAVVHDAATCGLCARLARGETHLRGRSVEITPLCLTCNTHHFGAYRCSLANLPKGVCPRCRKNKLAVEHIIQAMDPRRVRYASHCEACMTLEGYERVSQSVGADGKWTTLSWFEKSSGIPINTPKCSVMDCDKSLFGRGWCGMHYRRWLRHGDPLITKKRGSTKHGDARRGKQIAPEYSVWVSMRQRCSNPQNPAWKNYGGRGIIICERWWNSYEAFLADMGRRPSPEHSIDRIDNNGNYEPGNCQWATKTEQGLNRRPFSESHRQHIAQARRGGDAEGRDPFASTETSTAVREKRSQ